LRLSFFKIFVIFTTNPRESAFFIFQSGFKGFHGPTQFPKL
jgi:hypothetical protein